MPGTVCSVALCRSNSAISKKKGEYISFFTFPKEEKLRKKWVKKCYRKDKFNPNNKRVCSKHFKMDDFEDAIAAKLKNTIPRKLKFNAIPSLYLLPEQYDNDEVEKTVSDEERELRVRKDIVEQLLSAALEVERRKENEVIKGDSQFNEENEVTLQKRYNNVLDENKSLKDKIDKYENSLLELENKNAELLAKLDELEKRSKRRIRDTLGDIFSSNQLDVLLKKHSKAKWTNDDMRKAYILKSISKRAYLYVRHHLKYPLPSYSSVQKWEAINLYNHNGVANVTNSNLKSAVPFVTAIENSLGEICLQIL